MAKKKIQWRRLGVLSTCLGMTTVTWGCATDGHSERYEQETQVKEQASTEDSEFIVGGEVEYPGSWPWQAQLSVPGYSHWCGGSLINETHVVTAAHCVDGFAASNVTVRLGLHDRTAPDTWTQTRSLSSITVHELYELREVPGGTPVYQRFNNDVAVLELSSPVTFTERVKPIMLAKTTRPVGQESIVTGWGRTGGGQPSSATLLEATLPMVSTTTCQPRFGVTVTDQMVCAGYENGAQGACNGDSGGPLVAPSPTASGWELQGIVSWGSSGCNTYGVFAEVSEFRDWILSHTGPEAIMGDANDDHCVDMDDYNIIIGSYGQTVPPGDARADLNNDGWVDMDDYLEVIQNWGKGC